MQTRSQRSSLNNHSSTRNNPDHLTQEALENERTIIDQTIFTWEIQQWSTLLTKKKSHSPIFECAGYKW